MVRYPTGLAAILLALSGASLVEGKGVRVRILDYVVVSSFSEPLNAWTPSQFFAIVGTRRADERPQAP